MSLLETMGLVKPESSDQSVSVQQKPLDKPTRKVIQSPEKEVPKKESDVIQVMSTSDISDTSDEDSVQGSSDDSEDGRKVKKKGKKKKLKSGMMLKAKGAGIKVKVKWAQSMLGTKKRLILMIWTSLFLGSLDSSIGVKLDLGKKKLESI